MEKDINRNEKKKTGRNISNTDRFIAVFIAVSIVISIGVSVYASTIQDRKRLIETRVENIEITYSGELASRIRITPNQDDPDSDDIVICPDLQIMNLKLTEKINVFEKARQKLEEAEELGLTGEILTPAEFVVINIIGSFYTEDGEEQVLAQIGQGAGSGGTQFQLQTSVFDKDDIKLRRCNNFEVQDIQVIPCPAFIGNPVETGGLFVEPDTTMPSVLIGTNPEYPGTGENSSLPFVENCRLCSETLLPDARSFELVYEAGVLPERILAEYDIKMFRKWWTRDPGSATDDFRFYVKGNEAVALEILPDEEDVPGLTRYKITAAVTSEKDETEVVQSVENNASGELTAGKGNNPDAPIVCFYPDLISETEIRMPPGTILREYSAEEPLFQEFILEVPGGIEEPGKAIYYKDKALKIIAEEETGGCTVYKYELYDKPSKDSCVPAAAELLVSKKPVAGTRNYSCQVSIPGYAATDTQNASGAAASEKEKIIKNYGPYKLSDGSRIEELLLVGIPVDGDKGAKQSDYSENRLVGIVKKASFYPATLNIRVSWDKEGEGVDAGKRRRWFQESICAYPLSIEDMMTREIAFGFELGDDIGNLKVEEVQMIEWPLEFCGSKTLADEPSNGKPDSSPDEEISSGPAVDMLFQQRLPGSEINSDKSSDGLSLDCIYEAEYSGEVLLAFFDHVAFGNGWYKDDKISKGNNRKYTKADYELTLKILPEKTVIFEGLPGSYERTRYRLSIRSD